MDRLQQTKLVTKYKDNQQKMMKDNSSQLQDQNHHPSNHQNQHYLHQENDNQQTQPEKQYESHSEHEHKNQTEQLYSIPQKPEEQPEQPYQESYQPQQEQNDDYGGYDQYSGYDDYEGHQYSMQEDLEIPTIQKRLSSQNNKQYQMEDLLKIIQKQLKYVLDLTGFTYSWALIYFQSCGWKHDLVSKFIDTNNTHHQLINFILHPQLKFNPPQTICDICCLQDLPMIQNLCGHSYCAQCWKLHLKEKLMSFNKDPFPPCINEQCKNRVDPLILEQFSLNDQEFRKLYNRTLCRSYAHGNPSVKLCKGRKGFSCDTCFKIKKMFEILECQQCGNFVCAKCGDEYHQPSQCFDNKNWEKLADSAFVNFEMNNSTPCPTCKQYIHKWVGCNYIKCICKEEFCYVCGEKWLPNHNDHFNCYRAKQMGAMLVEKKKKLEDEKNYLQKLGKEKKEVKKYEERLKKVEQVNLKDLVQKLVSKFKILSNDLDYLWPLKRALRISLLMEKSIRIAKYFDNEDAMKLCVLNIQDMIKEGEDFLLEKIPLIFQSTEMMEKQSQIVEWVFYKGKKLLPREQLKKDKERMMVTLRLMEKWIKAL